MRLIFSTLWCGKELLESGWLESNSDVGFTVSAPPMFTPYYAPVEHSASAVPRSIEQLKASAARGTPAQASLAASEECGGPCFPWERELPCPVQARGGHSLWLKYVKHWMGIIGDFTTPSLCSARCIEIFFKFISHVDLALVIFSQAYFGAVRSQTYSLSQNLSEEEQQRMQALLTEEKDSGFDNERGGIFGTVLGSLSLQQLHLLLTCRAVSCSLFADFAFLFFRCIFSMLFAVLIFCSFYYIGSNELRP